MSPDVPFTTFTSNVIQLETDFKLPVMRQFFEPCFSAFSDLDARYAAFKADGIDYIVSAAGVEMNFGFRPRRFAGGPGLPPGRYFTVCNDDAFGDGGTLRDEITAYYSGESGITVTILDPKVDTFVHRFLRQSGGLTDEDLRHPLFCLIYVLERPTEKNKILLEQYEVGKRTLITYGVRQFTVELPKVVDLRYADTQEWFLRTFVHLEIENEQRAAEETRMIFPPKLPIESFAELLPVIVSLETGGGMLFGQAVGQWLRRAGANGLVFPSARSNAYTKVHDGKVSMSSGWNLILYVDAEPPVTDLLFGRMIAWRDKDHDHIRVNHQGDGPHRGSFSIRGLREFNLLQFDLEKQIAVGTFQENPLMVLTGTQNALLSRAVNSILDSESAHRDFWYNDVDYMDFTSWHERRWRESQNG